MRPLQEIAGVRQQKTKFQWLRLDEILWFYDSHETFSKLLLHGINHLECGSILTFISMDEILWCYHSNEPSSTVLSHGTISLVCSSNFWVCGWIPMVWPFKWKLFSRTIAWCYLIFGLFKRKFGICCEFLLWPRLGVKRLSSDIFKRNKMLFPLKAQKDKCCFAVAQRVLPSISLLLADFPLNNQKAH